MTNAPATYMLTLPAPDVELILKVLAERPLRESMHAFLRITQQIAPQRVDLPKPAQTTEPNGAEAHE